jgi:glycosyltransferase involved in cell wall biosynthesis
MDIHFNSCRVIYNPFDIGSLRREAAEAPGDLPVEPYIVHVGAFRREKRHDILLQAYAKLRNPPLLKLFCDYHKELADLIDAYGLRDKVEIFGFRKNPYPYIRQAKLLVLSSEREGLPGVLIETLILQTPVVSTDCISGPSEILTGKLRNYLAEVNNPKELSEKMQYALSFYPSIEDKYVEKFSEERIFQQYIDMLENQKDNNDD